MEENSRHNFEIILIEQDVISKIDFKLPDNCRHVFVYSNKPYNRSWSFNVGAKISFSDILFFSDSDILIDFYDILKCLDIFDEGHDAIDPKGFVFYLKKDQDKFDDIKNLSVRKSLSFCSCICAIKKSKFFYINGWDEDFVGWGAEDEVMSYKITSLLKDIITLGFDIYHLYHNEADKNKKFYNNNIGTLNKVLRINKNDLFNYYSGREIGNIDKYKV